MSTNDTLGLGVAIGGAGLRADLRNHLLKFIAQNRLILALLLAWRQLRRRRLERREA